jgi:anti-anti-sigma regulatory factor
MTAGQKAHRITLPAQINAGGLLDFLALIGQPITADHVTLDFRDLQRIYPAGLTALVAVIKHWERCGHRIVFEGLGECSITAYLQRLDLLSACGIQLPEKFRRFEPRGRFVPLQPIGLDVTGLGHAVAACVAPGGDEIDQPLSGLYDLVWYVVTEMANNVRQHSGGVGYASAQVARSEGFVRLAFGDNGKGILKSFQDVGLPWSHDMTDSAAIRKAIEPRVSSKGSPTNEGVGLTLVTEMVRQIKSWLLIVSGRGVLTLLPTGEIECRDLDREARYPGTLVAVTARQTGSHDFAALLTSAKVEAGLLHRHNPTARFDP